MFRILLRPFTLLLLSIPLNFRFCTYFSDTPELGDIDVHITILHTSDIHSRLLPYELHPSETDENLGLLLDNGPFGGIARVGRIIEDERGRAGRCIYLDSGDIFQGAPIFNIFMGEAEMRTLSEINPDAVVLGNHEFDLGAENLAEKLRNFATFPVLTANYRFDDPDDPVNTRLGNIVQPYTILNLNGFRVGVIGLGNLSSMLGIGEGGNSQGVTPLDTYQIVEDYLAILEEEVDLVIVLSHLGYEEDQALVRNVSGIDIVLGGHNHIVTFPPTVLTDPSARDVLINHPGAFAKFVYRLDLIVRNGEIEAFEAKVIPVDSTVSDDPDVYEILEPYIYTLYQELDLDRVVGIADSTLYRYGSLNGDSMMGNFVAEAMQFRDRVETDFALTNTLGMRTDLQQGEILLEDLYNFMPFENTLVKMFISGREVQELFDYSALRSAERGCISQIQISGAEVTLNCSTLKGEDITIAGVPMVEDWTYELVTSNYLAGGGSGFEVLQRNTTQYDTGISLRSAVVDYMEDYPNLPDYEEEKCLEDGRIRMVY